jgi:KUP system potassium uptake protein
MIGGALFFVMATWARGSDLVRRKVERDNPLLEETLSMLASRSVHRASGTAVFLTADSTRVPTALFHNLKHNRVLHEANLIVSVRGAQTPRVPEADRAEVHRLSADFTRITLTHGYMETPNVPRELALLRSRGVKMDIMSTSFFVGRRTLVHAASFAAAGGHGPALHLAHQERRRPHRLLPHPAGRWWRWGRR